MITPKIKFTIAAIFLCASSLFAKEKIITTNDGVKLYVEIKGEGVPCLFIHGGPGQGSFYWQKFGNQFSENQFKMIYLDQRGCGRSSSPQNNDYSLNRMIKDFETIRKSLNIDEWFIMGHSFGGILQATYAEAKPSKIKGILMFQCTLDFFASINSQIPKVIKMYNLENTDYLTNKAIPIKQRIDSMYLKIAQKNIDPWAISFTTQKQSNIFRQIFSEMPNEWNQDFSKEAFEIDDYNKNFYSISDKINIPVLFFYGTEDINIGTEHLDQVKFPKVLYYSIKGKHMDFIDNKIDYQKAINDFLFEFY